MHTSYGAPEHSTVGHIAWVLLEIFAASIMLRRLVLIDGEAWRQSRLLMRSVASALAQLKRGRAVLVMPGERCLDDCPSSVQLVRVGKREKHGRDGWH